MTDPAAPKPPLAALYCPHCSSRSLTVLSVASDYRSVRVTCGHCRQEATLMTPPPPISP